MHREHISKDDGGLLSFRALGVMKVRYKVEGCRGDEGPIICFVPRFGFLYP